MRKFSSKEGEISYLSQGKGPHNFLLVHNAGGSHEMMSYTTEHFSQKGKVIVPDLLGHGASAKPQIEYTLDLYAENLLQLCKYEKMESIIFIGLNYGADIGIEIAKRAPKLLSRLVLIEPPFFMEPWIAKLVEEHIKHLANPQEGWVEETVNSVIMRAPEKERQIALKALKMVPPFVKASTYENLLAWDKKHSFQCSIPTLMIQASKTFCTEEKARTVFSKLEVSRVAGSGPWANLEVPLQVHSMIDRFLELC
jgi:pimeloyl-ACP methyl ester carboxylesterase